RRPDRPASVLGVQGCRGGDDLAVGPGIRPLVDPRGHHCPRHLRDADARRPAPGSAGLARAAGAASSAAGTAGRVRQPCSAHRGQRHAQRRDDPLGRSHPDGSQMSRPDSRRGPDSRRDADSRRGADFKPGVEALPTADFFDFETLLSVHEQGKLNELREFLDKEIAPHASGWWDRAEFPYELLPELAALRLSPPAHRGYSHLFAGLVIAEMTRVDTSIATFFLVHHDLFVEALYAFGSEDQKARYLDDASNLRSTGAFALTEPGHGSDIAGGMQTVARRVKGGPAGDEYWVLNGAKRWIGNGTFCDHMLVWARDEADGAVRGFILDPTLPGVTRTKIENKIALRTVQKADIEFKDVRIAEADRFAGISTFEDTNLLLRGSRIMVAWQAVGQQLAAFDVARQYAVERHQFGRPLAKFQLIQQQ